MPVEVIWTPQAREDVLEIYILISMDQPAAAEKFLATMEAKITLLCSHPRLGVRRPEIKKSARILIEGAYLLLYETHPNSDNGPIVSVEIVRVVDGRRDLTVQF